MHDVMLDLETLGTGPNAAIVAIGAVFFDSATGELGPTFYAVVDLGNAVLNGGVMDADTVLWWLRQSEEARAVFTAAGKKGVYDALREFDDYLTTFTDGPVKLWGNGSDFDNVILGTAYARCGLELPWKFYNNRCYRTVKGLHPEVKMERQGTHHNALDDAISQAKHLIAILHPGQV